MSHRRSERIRNYVLSQIAKADVAQNGNHRQEPTLTISIGDVDLPAFVSAGILYIQAPLPKLFEAFAEDLSEFISDLEVRVSTPGGASLSFDSDGRPILESHLVEPELVPDSGER